MSWLLLTLTYLVVATASYAVLVRLGIGGNFVVKFVGCGFVFWSTLALHHILLGLSGSAIVAALLVFAFVWELNIFAFALISRSVSVGILMRLRERPLTLDEIQRHYSTAFMVDDRITRLVADGYLAPDQTGFSLTRRARALLRLFAALRAFFGHPELAALSADAPEAVVAEPYRATPEARSTQTL